MVLSDLKKGQKAEIKSFDNVHLALKFLEIGVVPGAAVSIYSLAPFGDPIAVDIEGSKISMRKQEAKTVNIELI
jgi:ferrous iron transport protein A